MNTVLSVLSPTQVDALLNAYDFAAASFDQAVLFITDTLGYIVMEDVML